MKAKKKEERESGGGGIFNPDPPYVRSWVGLAENTHTHTSSLLPFRFSPLPQTSSTVFLRAPSLAPCLLCLSLRLAYLPSIPRDLESPRCRDERKTGRQETPLPLEFEFPRNHSLQQQKEGPVISIVLECLSFLFSMSMFAVVRSSRASFGRSSLWEKTRTRTKRAISNHALDSIDLELLDSLSLVS